MIPANSDRLPAVPDLYMHFAHSQDQIKSIIAGGFDLKQFGFTAKKFRQQDLMRSDPRGVFALDATDMSDQGRPYVVFRLDPRPRVLTRSSTEYPGESENLKQELAQHYGVSGQKLANILLRANIQVLHSTTEYIVLDPGRIQIVRTSLST